MCGIAGYLTLTGETEGELRHRVHRMCDAIAHRGPDGDGVWCDPSHGIALGHRRLAVVDLSPQGDQPMASACQRYVIVYNGEIYNHNSLRADLDGIPWRGHSDTETLLACFTRYGVLGSLDHLVGMFAFAVWDRQECKLTLVRDRMGEKPLYWGPLPSGDWLFGSELKALRAHPRWHADIDRDALALYMRHGAIPAPHCVYRGFSKLPPGGWVELAIGRPPRQGRYWDIVDVAERGRARRAPMSDRDATDHLETLLSEAVRGQMVADVPLGAFLSGGVDSSTVVALMACHSSMPVRTFSIGFREDGFDEAAHASAVARHLQTSHTELYVTAQDAFNVIPRLPSIYDEPFADASQIPTFLVAQMARRHVTVSLSGDAGDELFAGYNRYLLAERIWNRMTNVPLALRRLVARMIVAQPPQRWSRLGERMSRVVPALRGRPLLGDQLHKFAASVLPAATQSAMYLALVSHWSDPSSLVLNSTESHSILDDIPLERPDGSVEQMTLLDQASYLTDDILVKIDRAAMASSLETRVPLLDHRIVEFAWHVPMRQKIRDGRTKWLLREVLYRHVPRELIERPKQGFGVPLDAWLRGPLRAWAEGLLDPTRLSNEGLLNTAAVRAKWDEHMQGGRNWAPLLWDVLMLQAWLDSLRSVDHAARATQRSEVAA